MSDSDIMFKAKETPFFRGGGVGEAGGRSRH